MVAGPTIEDRLGWNPLHLLSWLFSRRKMHGQTFPLGLPSSAESDGCFRNRNHPAAGLRTSQLRNATSVTSIAALAILPFAPGNLDNAVAWISDQVYRDDFSFALLLAKALHLPPAHAPGKRLPGIRERQDGSPPLHWRPSRSCGLRRQEIGQHFASSPRNAVPIYLAAGVSITAGTTADPKTRSEDAISYPETTGLAMLALRAGGVAHPSSSVELAHRFASRPESLEGLSWIQMALQAPGQPVPDPKTMPVARTTRDPVALRLLTLSAQGRQKYSF